MWIFTRFGFFSVVERHSGDDFLTVRARSAGDLDLLRDEYLPELSATVAGGGSDYPFRATVEREALARAMAEITRSIRYDNFKDTVKEELGAPRAKMLDEVWDTMRGLEKLPMAYGGVVFDSEGRVLLREPSNHYDGYVWTFPKGRPDDGETSTATALREVLEETGFHCEIVRRIPGSFAGGTTVNEYYLMRPIGAPGIFGRETASVRWVGMEEARSLIQLTTNQIGKSRDLAVLDAAVKLRERVDERAKPTDLEIERAVLSASLADPSLLASTGELAGSDFVDERYCVVFEVMAALWRETGSLDPVVLRERLPGFEDVLLELSGGLRSYLPAKVRERSLLRQLVRMGNAVMEGARGAGS